MPTADAIDQLLHDAADYLQTKLDASEPARNDAAARCTAGHAAILIRQLHDMRGIEMALILRPAAGQR